MGDYIMGIMIREVNGTLVEESNAHSGGQYYSTLTQKDKDMIEVAKMEARAMLREQYRPNRIVGAFGIQGEDGRDILMAWRVSGYRKDRSHGAVGEAEPATKYGQSLFDSMFKGWK